MGQFLTMIAISLGIGNILAAHPWRFHQTRERGLAKIDIFVSDEKAELVFVATSPDVFGFDQKLGLVSHEEQKNYIKIRKIFERDFQNMIILDQGLGCQWQPKAFHFFISDDDFGHVAGQQDSTIPLPDPVEVELSQTDMSLRYSIRCKKSMIGSKISFAVSKYFPKIQRIDAYAAGPLKAVGMIVHNDFGDISIP